MENPSPVSQTEWWRSKPHEVSEDRLSKSGNILVIKLHVLMKISRIYESTIRRSTISFRNSFRSLTP